ncbi:MAG: M48 family metallopeptidase [Pseudomonadota bacterium]
MSYENPAQREDINVSAEHPLKEFVSLLLALVLIAVTAITVLTLSAQWLAQFVPFSMETRLVDTIGSPFEYDGEWSEEDEARQTYLRELAERLSPHLELPDDMVLTLHYDPGSTVNAYASLGGHLVLYGGLLDKVTSENALAMVVAHEIAHIKLRHPIVASSRGLTVALAVTALLGFTDNSLATQLVNQISLASSLSYSRAQERAADDWAAKAVLAEYGHLDGADQLFEALRSDSAFAEALNQFQGTHPAIDERIETVRARARSLGVQGTVTPLPWTHAAPPDD